MDEREQVLVTPFRPEFSHRFEELNREWIEQYFALETADLTLFSDPYGAIVAPGGQIFFVMENGDAVGTCAVVRESDRVFELAKMAVTSSARGRGYGDLLIRAAIDFARASGAHKLVLASNSRLTTALSLYEKHGFRHVPISGEQEYERVDVLMELDLQP